MKLADTNRLMDKCESCGGWPCLEYEGKNVRGSCMDCCETSPHWTTSWGIAIIEWNNEQRKTNKRILPVVPAVKGHDKEAILKRASKKNRKKRVPKINHKII